MGSLIAALASYLDARYHDGTWLLRMEDIDPPREEPGASQSILTSLESHGLLWDEDVLFQSQRSAAYAQALDELSGSGMLFSCSCTRQQMGPGGACSGHCRQRQKELEGPTATRVAVAADCLIRFTDQVQGPLATALGLEISDFVVKRKDGLDAYQLAVVVDDAWQDITHIVRGSDLLDSTARQIFLQQLLGYPTPQYSHLPVIVDEAGNKLSKQNHAPALDDDDAPANLRAALVFLHQSTPPSNLLHSGQILDYAQLHWRPENIPAVMSIATASCAP